MARRRLAGRVGTALVLWITTSLLVGVAGSWYIKRALNRIDTVAITPAVAAPEDPTAAAVAGAPGPTVIENYLLIGSDSRTGADVTDPDYGGIGTAKKTEGNRSDTMMVLRYDPAAKTSSLLSIPRDLWVTIADINRRNRINEAFDRTDNTKRSQNMIDTVSKALGIPIDHYVEVNFAGFKKLVDAIGGVDVPFDTPVRDKHTGLRVDDPGCWHLDGIESRQYVRSRFYEKKINGKWVDDGSSDLGRTERQRDFIRRAINKALKQLASNPGALSGMLSVLSGNVLADSKLDILGLANQLKGLGGEKVIGYSLTVNPVTIGGAQVLQLDQNGSRPVLSYFAGTGPAPTGSGAGAAASAPVVIPAPVMAPLPEQTSTSVPAVSCP